MLYFVFSSFSKLYRWPNTSERWDNYDRGESGNLLWQDLGHHLWHKLGLPWCSGGMQTTRIPFNRWVAIYAFIYMCVCVCMYIYTHIYIYMYILVHTWFDLKTAIAGARSYFNAYFGYGTGFIHLDRLGCTGREQALLNCSHSGLTVISYYCGHDDDAGIRCFGRLKF